MNNRIKNWIINLGRIFPDSIYLKFAYYLKMKKRLNLENPVTFNEKIQWLKLNDRRDIYPVMADKYKAKEYISSIISNEYIIPTIGVWDNFEDIRVSDLPNKFVLKTTHDSGGVVICKNKEKFDPVSAKKKLNNHLNTNYYYIGREWPYKNIKPRIIAEEFLEGNKVSEIKDYKFFCFNGKPRYILVCSDRSKKLKETFFDLNWNIAKFKRPNFEVDKNIKKPINFDKMIEISTALSKNIPFLRVDFFETQGKLYIGELTFYPAGGFGKFEPEVWDYKLGDMIDLKK